MNYNFEKIIIEEIVKVLDEYQFDIDEIESNFDTYFRIDCSRIDIALILADNILYDNIKKDLIKVFERSRRYSLNTMEPLNFLTIENSLFIVIETTYGILISPGNTIIQEPISEDVEYEENKDNIAVNKAERKLLENKEHNINI